MLYGLAVSQATQYFTNFPNDSPTRKALVATSLVFCLVALVGAYVDVYEPTVTFWGDISALSTETWSVPVYTIFNTLTGTIVNSYLISRFYTLSKNIVVTVFLGVVVLFILVMAFVSTLVHPFKDPAADFKRAELLGLMWAISSAVCDVLIAVSLVWTLRGMKTTFKETNQLVHRVMQSAIQNGCATSITALAGMVACIFKIDSNIPTLFYFLLGPLYCLTLLSNFNLRESGKSGSRQWSSSRNNHTNTTNIVIDGIRESIAHPAYRRMVIDGWDADVRRTAIVTVDQTESEMELPNRKRDEGSTNQKQEPSVDSFRAEDIKVSNFSPN
ncbi:hypothetical protein B0H11DRAFT_2280076 [Mycena galericulata]|nr:hypothetical protein B0H11DRAFT_2280076 [Mycena galericulata]